MAYFSRLTDIVTCNLTEILSRSDEPQQAIEEIIREMDEGLAGAQRSVANATAAEERIRNELAEQQAQIDVWAAKAKEELQSGDEDAARLALIRKREVEDVIAGLEQQHRAAISTREHLNTTYRALEARLAEARRKMDQLGSAAQLEPASISAGAAEAAVVDENRQREIEDELAALKRELKQ